MNFESTRRRLSEAQALTVARLTDAVVDVVRDKGAAAVTVRAVAAKAGVAPATAYTYFSSKSHLLAETFWRRLARSEVDYKGSTTKLDRATAVLRSTVLLLNDEPQLATAVTAALLGDDPDVVQLRVRIGAEIRRRLIDAIDDGSNMLAPSDLIVALEMVYAGALVNAGLGYSTYSEVADSVTSVARIILK